MGSDIGKDSSTSPNCCPEESAARPVLAAYSSAALGCLLTVCGDLSSQSKADKVPLSIVGQSTVPSAPVVIITPVNETLLDLADTCVAASPPRSCSPVPLPLQRRGLAEVKPVPLSATASSFTPRLFGIQPPVLPLIPPVLSVFKQAAAFFTSPPPTTSFDDIQLVVESLPVIHPNHYCTTLQLCQDLLPDFHDKRFDIVALFDLARGSKWIESKSARTLWMESFSSGSLVALGYDGERFDTKINPTGKVASVVQKGAMPNAPKPDPHQATAALLGVLNKGVERKTYLGPFTKEEAAEQFGFFVTSTIFGISDSTRSTTKLRLIHNMSSKWFSVNGFIRSEFTHTLDYTSIFFKALDELSSSDVWFGSLDISRGYRRFRTQAMDIKLQGLSLPILESSSAPSFDGKTEGVRTLVPGEQYFWFDTTMPFGSKSAPYNFCSVTIAVRELVKELASKAGVPGTMLCFVDDFICTCPTEVSANYFLSTLRTVLKIIRLPEEPTKAQPVSTTARYLGVDYDGINHTATLPDAKRAHYIKYLQHLVKYKSVKRKDLDSMVHRLRHAAAILRAGKPFFSNLLTTLRKCHTRFVQLSPTDRDDIHWWIHLLQHVKPKVIIGQHYWSTSQECRIYTDASLRGYGAFFNGKWFNGSFTEKEQAAFKIHKVTINEFELLVILFAIATWGHLLAGKRITFYCDNSASVASVTSKQSRVAVRAAMLRHLFAIAIIHSIDLRIIWLDTKANVIADSLSRFDLTQFFKLTTSYTLQQEKEPILTSRALLLFPKGPQNPTNPEWRP